MKIQKTDLAQKLNKIKGVVPKKTTMPVLQGILVRDGYLIASNMEMTVKAKIEGTEGESFIIPERAFDLINNLPDGEMEISAAAGNIITIKADKIKNKYQTLDPAQFPTTASQDEGSELRIKAEMLLESMKRVSYAVPAQNTNTVMTAMCLQAAGGQLNFAGLDGHVLAWDKIDYDGEFELLIPKNTVDKMKSLGLSGEVQIRHNKTGAVFITEDFEIYTRLIEGEYFKYQTLFKELPLHTVVSRIALLDAMTRAKMCTEERCPVRFELEGGSLSLSIKDKTTDYHETIELQENIAETLTIGFDARLVLETLKAFDCENVGLSFGGPKMPMIVEAEDSDFKTIVLPVAI
ncbi:DNA polymerase III subunit beta [Acetatifactor muris]|uniref:Beta sliding clamp n=1 Tax=Acetatifactor muris TaxID=879566 RepID=A0A2K4ZKQ4_9FIRM|nr:DNA polymerase III subunit beta [Acetatifactor muris]MCR2049550.1 DNA polymerase III subunit beta [Acetatifactor muris]SOY31068.1 DNA polymerase III subunit beta [Acetatifactor muris]